jgi:hypothetical protein
MSWGPWGASVADNFGPNNVYANVPRIDSKGRSQIPMFTRWNPDPVGNDARNLSALNPDMQKVIAQARADNPNLNFVIGNGKRSAADQDQAKAWGWSKVGSKDGGDANVHMQGNAVDLWGLDGNGRVQFDPSQQKEIAQAMQNAAQKLGVGVNWGGNFKTFKDAPHFELAGGGSAASSGAPEGPTSTSAPQPSASSGAAPSGTTLNSNVIDTLSKNIASIESGGDYKIVNSRTGATGKYQVMPFNVGPWTQQALGHSMTPAEFRASPSAQEAVFRDQASRALATMSPVDFASTWFTGKPYSQSGAGKSDYLGTTNQNYVTRATAGIDNAGTFTPGSTINTTGKPPGAPTAVAGGPAAPAAPGQPGPAQGNWMTKLASSLTPQGQDKGGAGGGGDDQPQQMMQLPQAPQAQPVGGRMMLGPGGQNTLGRSVAEQQYAQQGFMMQPSLAANAMGANMMKPPVPSTLQSTIQPMAPGAATGMPGLPGTTLNSPSQLQMALMTGAMNPYDLYGGGAYGGAQFGST